MELGRRAGCGASNRKDSTPDVAGGLLRCRISVRLMSRTRQTRSSKGRSVTSALHSIMCKTRFAQVVRNSKGCQRDFHVEILVAPRKNPQATSVTRLRLVESAIASRFGFFAKNSQPRNFRLLRHNPLTFEFGVAQMPLH